MAKKAFEFRVQAQEVMLEHLPPMGTGSKNEEHLVLDSLALYNSVLEALHMAWAAGRDTERERFAERLEATGIEAFEHGKQHAKDTVHTWHKPTGGEDGEF